MEKGVKMLGVLMGKIGKERGKNRPLRDRREDAGRKVGTVITP